MLYAALGHVAPSPVVELNRAVAVGRAIGPEAGLGRSWTRSPPSHRSPTIICSGVRGDLLEQLGRLDEARGEFERAALLTANARERDLLMKRAETCGAN